MSDQDSYVSADEFRVYQQGEQSGIRPALTVADLLDDVRLMFTSAELVDANFRFVGVRSGEFYDPPHHP